MPENPAQNAPAKTAASDWALLSALAAFALLAFVYPAARAFYRLEVGYNEGWNVYTAQAAMLHQLLYYPRFGWTTVNYPLVSFYVVGWLGHAFGGDYLLAGRLLSLASLLACCALVAAIVRKLTRRTAPAFFAAFFCLALFCTRMPAYVGADDPQMFGQPFVLAGLLLFLGGPPENPRLAGVAVLFALAGNIKQILVSGPLAVVSDLFLASRRRAVVFLYMGVVLLALSVAVNILVGGPYFLSILLAPRNFSLFRLQSRFVDNVGPLLLPVAMAVLWCRRAWPHGSRPAPNHKKSSHPAACVLIFYFAISLAVGAFLAGGEGVAANAYADFFLALSMLMGLCLHFVWNNDDVREGGALWRRASSNAAVSAASRRRWLVPVLAYLSLFISFAVSPKRNVPLHLARLPEVQRQFDSEAAFIAAQPGPALCENLIRCYYAGKPYVLDPFNSATLMRRKKLDSAELVGLIAAHTYGVIQLDGPAATRPPERFPREVIDAINRDYAPARNDLLLDADSPEHSVLYLPRP